MTDVVQKLWGFCNTLRDEGMNYGQYIEQLTYLLFLKMAEEKNLPIPKKYNWNSLLEKAGVELLEHYQDCLKNLAKEGGILSDIFAGAISQFREPINLKKLVSMINEERWSAIDVDIKGAAYEGLLQKYAAEQKGAGQYFTPRELIRAIVKCMDPKVGETLHDPALGTAGFLIGAFEYLMHKTDGGATLSREQSNFLRKKTFSGNELVLETKRLAMMNIYLHGIEAAIYYGDSLNEGPHVGKKYKVVMTNPPFGVKSGGVTPTRGDFNVTTSNKQLNFVQHVMSILDNGGRAAMVAPDNVLFDSGAGTNIRKILLEDVNLHTILRLPEGTFTPYSTGVKANVIFFSKPGPTKEIWIYDLRTNIDKIAKKSHLTAVHFKDFVDAYKTGRDGNPTLSQRKETERFRKFMIDEIIQKRHYNLDITWMKNDSNGNLQLPQPKIIIKNIAKNVQAATKEIAALNKAVNKQEIPDGIKNWEYVKLRDVILEAQPGFACGKRDDKGYVQLRMNNISSDGRLVLDKVLKIPQSEVDIKKYRLVKEDILFNNTNSPELIGKTAIFNGEIDDCVYSNHITRIRVNTKLAMPKWIKLVLVDEHQKGTFELMCHRFVGQAGISREKLLSLEIPLPPLEEQKRIVNYVQSIFEHAQRLKESNKSTQELADKIKISFTSAALRGELRRDD